ncbi:DUF2235 domain-containing protein [Halopseudomonas pelagia]|uniref:DUF2235 domain-containing protein n=1 Tax=Halopseudomonas pelagia TaxID=553151 RepID=A0AA91U0E9_9GAMM|nr:DUF2235 domain-containing protein [Halopseudomonas pelagia]PCC98349.1 hypothetical protein CO192_16335 [Halopseudomonas pelagia]QFY56638.1 DUF2235 domain-containing protein [Halopseudomonas pelagia]
MKRIVICADGTWQSPESDKPTHVLRIAQAVAPADAQGNRQVVFYDWGVGSEGDRLTGGVTGKGIDKNIMDCYRFIVHNYDVGDQLFLFGFSRGAYTVRSLGGLIRNCGILKRAHAGHINAAYELYRQRSPASSPGEVKARQFRKDYAVADISQIEFIGVFDTVGALGIPAPFLGTLGTARYLFHDTEPSGIICHARHAVAIDENREDFEPALWTLKPGIDLKQVWFAGVHTDIGGGYPDHSLGDYAGVWICREAQSAGLHLEAHLQAQLQPNHLGSKHNEYKGFYRIMRRSRVRVPEAQLHRSVRKRWEDPAAKYSSPGLRQLLKQIKDDWSKVSLFD